MTAFCRGGSYAKYWEIIPTNVDHLRMLLLCLSLCWFGWTNVYLKKHSVLCLRVRKKKKTLFIRKRLSWLSCSNNNWKTNSKWLRFQKPFLPTLVTDPVLELCSSASLDVKLPALLVARPDLRRVKLNLKQKPCDQVFVVSMHPMQSNAWQNWAYQNSPVLLNNILRFTSVSETTLPSPELCGTVIWTSNLTKEPM